MAFWWTYFIWPFFSKFHYCYFYSFIVICYVSYWDEAFSLFYSKEICCIHCCQQGCYSVALNYALYHVIVYIYTVLAFYYIIFCILIIYLLYLGTSISVDMTRIRQY